jgi:hypothetical protein
MIIGILNNPKSYLPEIHAYSEILKKKFKVIVSTNEDYLNSKSNLIIKFPGFFYKKFNFFKNRSKKIIIHDYASLSTPPFAKIKNLIKCYFSETPNLRIYNSNFIKKEFSFKDNTPYLIRSAGVDKKFFFKENEKKKRVAQIIYVGSFRDKLCVGFEKILKFNLNLIVIGNFPEKFKNKFKFCKNIFFLGFKTQDQIIEILKVSEYGLNYIPDIYPWNYQASLKLLEYSAVNLKTISNKTKFALEFEKKFNSKFNYIENINNVNDILNFNYINGSINSLEWNNILQQCNFFNTIDSLIDNI